ncbi:PREDICTED: uncharacterized protein LOC109236236 isoform X2 [Nicotiana attenuata]|uniref:uncharacterized protein LOC109236236 isoform X2 n=1 Tax=Nicotiana attenuata TaxID=49451 RepID=UPI00090588B3|nr:PREDICTED: uncharacterized protein LOC109236236 isoform X2 [Nicotiana attenuata]
MIITLRFALLLNSFAYCVREIVRKLICFFKENYINYMATTLQNRGLVSLGKRVLNQFSGATSANSSTLSACWCRRAVHISVYDKNPEEYISSVPDEIIGVGSDKYWTPHPQTGVFGPPTHHIICGDPGYPVDSVLEQMVFFRDREDLEKPTYS